MLQLAVHVTLSIHQSCRYRPRPPVPCGSLWKTEQWNKAVATSLKVCVYVQCIRKVFRPLEVLHILLPYSLILKWITKQILIDLHKITHNDKWKQVFQHFCKWKSIVSRHRSGEEYQKVSAALKVPKNTVASIILKWKKFGTTNSS